MKGLRQYIRQLWHQLKRRWLPILVGSFSLFAMLNLAEEWYAGKRAQSVSITIDNQANFSLVDAKQVKALLNNHLPASIAQYTLHSLPLGEIEALLEQQVFIANAEIFTQMDGLVKIRIDQRTPLVRVINADQDSYYLDQSGERMPFSPAYKRPMITATGSIEANESDSLTTAMEQNLKAIHKVSRFIRQDSFLRALTGQLYITRTHDIELIPRIGEQTIILGEAQNLPRRFAKLKAFYRKVIPNEGWYKYEKISLKYDKQIVAKK